MAGMIAVVAAPSLGMTGTRSDEAGMTGGAAEKSVGGVATAGRDVRATSGDGGSVTGDTETFLSVVAGRLAALPGIFMLGSDRASAVSSGETPVRPALALDDLPIP